MVTRPAAAATTALLVLVLTIAVIGSASAAAPAQIQSMVSTVTVFASGSLQVHEHLTLVTTGGSVTRLLPQDAGALWHGSRATPSWRVQSASIDGSPTTWQIRAPAASRLLLEVGSNLGPGQHTLDLTVITDRFLTVTATGANLVWDATGAWQSPVAQASVILVPPPGAGRSLLSAGASLQNAIGRIGSLPATQDMDGNVILQTSRPLAAGESIVVHASWPAGTVSAPTSGMRIDWFIRDWGGIVMGLFGLLVLAAYFQSAWMALGKDPLQGAVIPRFEPPADMSPAAVRYVRHMAFDETAFAADLLDLGSRGAALVSLEASATVLRRAAGTPADLPADEQLILEHLFGDNQKALIIGPSTQPLLQSASAALGTYLETSLRPGLFDLHRRETLTGIGISFVTAVIAGMAQATTRAGVTAYLGLLAWLLVWSAGVAFSWAALATTLKARPSGRHARPASLLQALAMQMAVTSQERAERSRTAALAYCAAFWMAGAGVFFRVATIPVACLVIAMAVLDIVYGRIMPSWTLRGRQIADEADGFALYLKVAERDRMHWFTPPAKTPELLERYLPYALALGVQQEWAEQFRDTVSQGTAPAGA